MGLDNHSDKMLVVTWVTGSHMHKAHLLHVSVE